MLSMMMPLAPPATGRPWLGRGPPFLHLRDVTSVVTPPIAVFHIGGVTAVWTPEFMVHSRLLLLSMIRAKGVKRIGLPDLRSDRGQESGVSPGNCAIGGFISAAVKPGRSDATLGRAACGYDLPKIGGIENQLAYGITR